MGALLWAASLAGTVGCARFQRKPPVEDVYVLSKQTFLRDRVAAVSNRTAVVANGDKLAVLEHGRRFLRVRTDKGETGWIEERTVVSQKVADGFAALQREHAADSAVATAVLRDELYMHLSPGRDTERLYLLPEGEKLKLLERASLLKADPNKPPPPRASAAAKPMSASTGTKGAKGQATAVGKPQPAAPSPAPPSPAPPAPVNGKMQAAPSAVVEPPLMEDWWLVRDAQGQTGWLLARRLDVDVPDALSKYAEGQRVVGAYVLATVNDPDVDQPDKNVNEYVTVMSTPRDGLPYDFDQVRVYTWNLKKHRYETAYRERNVEGFLPVVIHAEPGTGATMFSYKVVAAEAGIVTDTESGVSKPSKLIQKDFRLEGNLIRRVLPPGQTASQQPQEAHPEPLLEKKKASAKKRRR